MRDILKCRLCDRTFRTVMALLKHVESSHEDINPTELEQYKLALFSTQVMMAGKEGVDKTKETEVDSADHSPGREVDTSPRETPPMNKFLMKSDKPFPYSLEKYLDPKRPFKCDVCKESFTQKNILLVHFNSVSHLHKTKKLKEHAAENPNNLTPQSEDGSPTSPAVPGSTLMSVLGSLNAKKQLEPDNELKPYKCNVCKVSYAQGSTLDIHIRSVLHNSRVTKLQELVAAGHVDLSKPLIENPDNDINQSALDLFSPMSINSNSATPNTPHQDREATRGPISSTPKSLMDLFSKLKDESLADKSNDSSAEEIHDLTADSDRAKSSHMLKKLLQNYGVDMRLQMEEAANKSEEKKEETNKEKDNTENKTVSKPDESLKKVEAKSLKCPLCEEHFANIWILKSHTEEEHKVLVPQEFVQKYVEELKSGNDSKKNEEDSISADEISIDEKKKDTDGSKSVPDNLINPFQQAFQAFREQEAKLQRESAIQNMNLHPPLIPGMMPFGHGNSNSHPSQLESQIFAKLGIDTDVVRQAGLDPKVLIHLAMIDPKAALDPKMLSMFTVPPRGPEIPNPKMLQLSMDGHMGMPPTTQGFPPGLPEIFKLNQKPMDSNKRPRTRITDDQLKVLRSNFDINNSPSEEQVNNLSLQTNLPPKVIKHWFRNTLFKERQKNKDSPYNFNNPPSTVLNLEEYEKTGESKVTQIPKEDDKENNHEEKFDHDDKNNSRDEMESIKSDAEEIPNHEIKKELDSLNPEEKMKLEELRRLQMSLALRVSISPDDQHSPGKMFDGMFSPHNNHGDRHPLLQSPLPPGFPPLGFLPMHGQLGSNIFGGFGALRGPSPLNDPNGYHNSAAAKRANRTRFTDYQIKVLQEFFENNAYPKDDDLEYLSKLLGLSPRVIVVWFQNARQKARKIYENQPQMEAEEEGEGRFTRTPGLNYQCKKCLLVFQRYYELIRHQKQHCFKEEDAKRSALAQRAAAHAAATFVGPGNISLGSVSARSDSDSGQRDHSIASPMSSNEGQTGYETNLAVNMNNINKSPLQKYIEESKNIGLLFDKRNQEERVIKYLSEAQANLMSKYPPNTGLPFMNKPSMNEVEELNNDNFSNIPGQKRKLSEDQIEDYDRDENGQPKDKRLRTTILPEQLDYLYQKYQIESNPSRKMLEQIANEVGLRKRVVQVWFQNTRARERKGQFRAHQQVINKKCPFCPALFKVRSALESHLVTKHASQYSRGEINIDQLPDAADENNQMNMAGRSTLFPSVPCPSSPTNMAANQIPNHEKSSEFEASMRKYYEETMKQFISDVKLNQQPPVDHTIPERSSEALDLSSPPLSKHDETKNLDGRESVFDNEDHVLEFDEEEIMLPGNQSLDRFDNRTKKIRTQLSSLQVKMMRSVFDMYKLPSMPDCQKLADFIGLERRVVQVWFQNARAKDKKARLQVNQDDNQDNITIPEQCPFCHTVMPEKNIVQQHIFDTVHLTAVKRSIEEDSLSKSKRDRYLDNKADTEKNVQSSKPSASPVNAYTNHQEANLSHEHQHYNNQQLQHQPQPQQQPQQHPAHLQHQFPTTQAPQQNFNYPPHQKYYPGMALGSGPGTGGGGGLGSAGGGGYRQQEPAPQHYGQQVSGGGNVGGQQEYPGFCQNQAGGYPSGPYQPFPPGYASGYGQGYGSMYPYQSGVQN